MQFEGIYTPLVTPYRADFSLNEAALAETVELLVGAGVHGIIVAGTTGEYYAQSFEERVDMMSRVKELIAGRVPMIVGTGAIRTEESVGNGPRDRPARAGHRPRGEPAGDALQLPRPHVREHGRGDTGQARPLAQFPRHQGKLGQP